tara:strand:+ start:583 stop:1017 length:435 start_codon:yes stop_codon:yes gene_type:complete
MKDNFNLKSFLTENNLTTNTRKGLNEEEGVPHYTKDGKEWKGKLHKMPNGSLMSGKPHDEGGSGPNGESEKLYHKEDLKEQEDWQGKEWKNRKLLIEVVEGLQRELEEIEDVKLWDDQTSNDWCHDAIEQLSAAAQSIIGERKE